MSKKPMSREVAEKRIEKKLRELNGLIHKYSPGTTYWTASENEGMLTIYNEATFRHYLPEDAKPFEVSVKEDPNNE